MRVRVIAFLCLIAFLTNLSFAQTTATIQGKVILEDGSGLPGATVLIESPKMIGTRTYVSRANGEFLFRRIPPGNYTVTTTMDGMQTDKRTVLLALGNVATPTIVMKVKQSDEVMTVLGSVDTVLESVEVSANFDSSFVDQLANDRDQGSVARLAPGVNFNGGSGGTNVSIAGANSGSNTWLINGADSRFDNIRSQPGDAIITDSIQETTVLTGAISAEYGQFGGGVINTVTKSGGNSFSGSYRLALSNQDWVARTPNELESDLQKVDDVNTTHTVTLGGPILKDRIWFFLAGLSTETNVASNFIAPNPISDRTAESYGLAPGQTAPGARAIPGRVDEDERFEIKLSGRIAEGHEVFGSWVSRDVTQVNRPQTAFDISATATRTITREQRSITYNGTFTPSFSIELQYSDRESVFEERQIPQHLQDQLDAGADIRIVGTALRNQRGPRSVINSPQFLGKPDEPRSNETVRLQANYFLVTDNFGSHDLTAGTQTISDERFADNRQWVNDWAFWSDFRYEGETAIPIYSPTRSGGRYQSRLIYQPIEISSQTTTYDTDSIFINDTWTLNDRWRFNIGFRYDKNEGRRADGLKSVDDDVIAPRLSINYDLHGDGKHEFSVSYSEYAQRIGDAADDGSQAGSTSFAWLNYTGPQTEDYLEVIQWVNDTYGEGFFEDPLNHPNTQQWEDDLRSNGLNRGSLSSPTQLFGVVDENGNIVTQGLSSPTVVESRLGYAIRFGNKGYFKVDYVHRDFEDFYTDHTNLQTGPTENGNDDLNLINNDDNLYSKNYDGVLTSFRWRFNEKFRLSGNYTWSQLIGNTDGGSQSGILSTSGALTIFPEYNNFPNRSPEGYLAGDQRHVANIFLFYNWSTPIGNFDFALSERYASGSPFSKAWTIDLEEFPGEYGLPEVGSVGYVDAPGSSTYFLSRGGERSDDLFQTNLGINWSLNILTRYSLFVEIDIINLFNDDTVHFGRALNTSIDELAPFNVFNETPIEGVHYELDDEFGQANSTGDFPVGRTFRVDVGFRF